MKPKEVYSFVWWVFSFVVFTLYLVWALLPQSALKTLGILFYPDKSWALALPSLIVMTIIFAQMFYQGLNMSITQEPEALDLIEDEFTRHVANKFEISEGLPEIHDIPITVVNRKVEMNENQQSQQRTNLSDKMPYDKQK